MSINPETVYNRMGIFFFSTLALIGFFVTTSYIKSIPDIPYYDNIIELLLAITVLGYFYITASFAYYYGHRTLGFVTKTYTIYEEVYFVVLLFIALSVIYTILYFVVGFDNVINDVGQIFMEILVIEWFRHGSKILNGIRTWMSKRQSKPDDFMSSLPAQPTLPLPAQPTLPLPAQQTPPLPAQQTPPLPAQSSSETSTSPITR